VRVATAVPLVASTIVISLTYGPSALATEASADAVHAAVEDVAKLPGHAVRRVYLEQLLEAPELSGEDARRVRHALQVLDAANAQPSTTAERLRRLLLMAVSLDPETTSQALHLARSGLELPATEAPEPESAESQKKAEVAPPQWFDAVGGGIGPLAWWSSRARVEPQLEGKATWRPIHAWEGPRYTGETGFLEFSSQVAGCGGDFSLFFNQGGFSRLWFDTGEPRCWKLLQDYLAGRHGPPSETAYETDAGSVVVLEWIAGSTIKLAIEGEQDTNIFVSVEAPPSDAPPINDASAQGYKAWEDGHESSRLTKQEEAKRLDRLARGRRLRATGMGTGIAASVFMAGLIGTEVGALAIADGGDARTAVILSLTGVGLGVTGGVLATIAGIQDTHGRILLRKAGASSRRAAPQFRIAVAPVGVGVTVSW